MEPLARLATARVAVRATVARRAVEPVEPAESAETAETAETGLPLRPKSRILASEHPHEQGTEMATTYAEFLSKKSQMGQMGGFKPVWLPNFLFDFQAFLCDWNIRKGRAATYADCGLGKSPIILVWAENVVRSTNGRVLIVAPLAVTLQFVSEGQKFGVGVTYSRDGKVGGPGVYTTNYERLHLFDPNDFSGVVCDESQIIKHWTGATQKAVTRFLSHMAYRLLATATPSPNDFIELGTSSEALGELTYSDMLATFFRQISDDEKKKRATADDIIHSKRLSWRVIQSFGQWALKPHAFEPFWRWVATWARACRKPSDLGPFSDASFVLPPLFRRDHTVTPRIPPPGHLFTIPAFGLHQERAERRRTIDERAELVAELVKDHDRSVIWCHLNPEGDRLEKDIPGAVQVKGTQNLEKKEELLLAFLSGQAPRLVTKAKIAGLGLNMQHCAHVVTFVDHSFESFYQSVRRCWRFGQKRSVTLDVIATEGEVNVRRNMERKEKLAATMFDSVVRFMNDSLSVKTDQPTLSTEIPAWLLSGTR